MTENRLTLKIKMALGVPQVRVGGSFGQLQRKAGQVTLLFIRAHPTRLSHCPKDPPTLTWGGASYYCGYKMMLSNIQCDTISKRLNKHIMLTLEIKKKFSMTINESYSDTPDEVEQYRLKLIAGLSPEERFSRMNRLCAFGTMAMLEGLREKNPHHTEEELRLLLAHHLHGPSFAQHIKSRTEIEQYTGNE